ncbi:hypothetical protein ABT336_17385 [Micromonospora sp. NPDC000207]|uniref:hypothetical protein n=1 Tax=Micromonospora sp. NPDC000207 TaxID=3154246 RepID=UPI003323854D
MCKEGSDPLGDFFKGFFDMISNPVGAFVDIIANLILSAAISIFAEMMDTVPTLGEGNGGSMAVPERISDQIEWVIVYLAVGSILFAATRMAMERRGEAGKTALMGFLRVMLVAGAGTWIATRVAGLSDDFADHLMQMAALDLVTDVACINGGVGPEGFLLLILAFLLLISGIVQILMMYIRLGVMMILLGTLPLAAAASMTNWGAAWWRKHVAWTVAWLIYKPAVGLIMYAGATMIAEGNKVGGGGAGIHNRLAGAGMLLLSAIALPALLKLIVPATAAMGGGNPAGNATSAAGNSVATGARKVSTGALSAGGGGGSRSGGGGGGRPSGSRDGASGAPGRAGGSGVSGGSGRSGAPGHSGGSGRVPVGAGAGGGGGGAASMAARAAGPVGAAIAVGTALAGGASRAAGRSIEGGGTNPDL